MYQCIAMIVQCTSRAQDVNRVRVNCGDEPQVMGGLCTQENGLRPSSSFKDGGDHIDVSFKLVLNVNCVLHSK